MTTNGLTTTMTTLALGTTLALAGCGGGGGSATTTTASNPGISPAVTPPVAPNNPPPAAPPAAPVAPALPTTGERGRAQHHRAPDPQQRRNARNRHHQPPLRAATATPPTLTVTPSQAYHVGLTDPWHDLRTGQAARPPIQDRWSQVRSLRDNNNPTNAPRPVGHRPRTTRASRIATVASGRSNNSGQRHGRRAQRIPRRRRRPERPTPQPRRATAARPTAGQRRRHGHHLRLERDRHRHP